MALLEWARHPGQNIWVQITRFLPLDEALREHSVVKLDGTRRSRGIFLWEHGERSGKRRR